MSPDYRWSYAASTQTGRHREEYVDGSLLPALPKMAWALWVDETHRAAKLHLHFDVFKGVPCRATIMPGNGNERQQLKQTLPADRLYVIDRGYAEYQLFQDIIDARSSFIGRIRDDANYEMIEDRPLLEDARQAGAVWDRVVNLGGPQSGKVIQQTLRIVAVKTGKTDSQGQPEVLLLATNCLDLDAAWIALGYKFRHRSKLSNSRLGWPGQSLRCPGVAKQQFGFSLRETGASKTLPRPPRIDLSRKNYLD